jgi:3-oxo-4-pregnene-20-carboxyl-CoA dehydrogenase alpha subunit
MNIDLSPEALEYGDLVKKALESAGGDELLQAIEREPEERERVVAPVLAGLGAWDLDPRGSGDELEAAAALCRAVGYWAVAYPVAERLCRPTGLDCDGLVVVDEVAPAAAIGGSDLRWVTVTLEGRRSRVTASPLAESPRTSAFVARLVLEPVDDDGAGDVALGLLLPCWTLLGMLDRALDLVRAYVLARQQFGQPLASFQGVQFQLTDAEVERAGAVELAKYALWSVESGQPASLPDALAARLAVLEAADIVLRVAHQLHGAIGFCDETVLSWVSRYSGPLRRLPFGSSGTLHQLALRTRHQGLSGLFDGGAAS